MLHRVTAALQGAEQLPLGCREMLVAMASGGLGSAKDDRHPSQVRVVEMVGSALDEVRAARDADVASESEKVKAAEEKMAALQAAAAAADAELGAQAEKVGAAEAELSEAAAAAAAAKGVCDGTEAAQGSAKDLEATARAESEAFDAAIKEQYATLLAGTWEEETQAQGLIASLKPFTARLTLDESLRTALPTACLRRPEGRGGFDRLVLEEARKALALKAGELHAKLAGCGPAVAEAAVVAEAARAQLSRAAAAEEGLAAALQAARGEVARREAACKVAAQEVKSFTKELKQVARERAAAEAERNRLQAPLDAFTRLRDGAEVADADAGAAALRRAELGA